MSKYYFKIYHPEHCAKCQFSKKYLEGFKVIDLLIDPEHDAELFTEFRNKGYHSFPVVEVYNEAHELVDEWNDLKIDKLKYYTGK